MCLTNSNSRLPHLRNPSLQPGESRINLPERVLQLTIPSTKLYFRLFNLLINLLPLSHNISSQVLEFGQCRFEGPDIRFGVKGIVAGTEGRGGNVGGTQALDEFVHDEFVAEGFELEELPGGGVEAVYVGRSRHVSQLATIVGRLYGSG